jgi:hypothetical protein
MVQIYVTSSIYFTAVLITWKNYSPCGSKVKTNSIFLCTFVNFDVNLEDFLDYVENEICCNKETPQRVKNIPNNYESGGRGLDRNREVFVSAEQSIYRKWGVSDW